MTSPPLGDMPVPEFRAAGHRLVDWIADEFEAARSRPVLARVAPGAIRGVLPPSPPEAGSGFETILADFARIMVPGLTQWSHPRYFAYFPCGFSSPGVLADFLSTAMSQQAMLWRTSPAATELEAVSLDWLRQAMGLPASWSGVIYDTASTGLVHALAAARHERDPALRQRGLAGDRRYAVYCSAHAHSSIDKAVITLGLGHDCLRRIPADGAHAMRVDRLAAAIEADLAAGTVPLAVMATVGTTSAASVDPVAAIAELTRRHRLWLHVDAAYAGAAAILPERRGLFAGVEHADSLIVNPHKWLFVPFDLSAYFSPKMDLLRAAFALTPEYLRTSDDPAVQNLMDTGFQLGRRFRALKLWTVMRYFGLEGLRARLREHIRLAESFAARVDADPGFERLAPVSLGVVCFRAVRPGLDEAELDRLNDRLLESINASGEMFLSHTKLDGKFVLRLAVGNIRTTEADVTAAWDLLSRHVTRVDA